MNKHRVKLFVLLIFVSVFLLTKCTQQEYTNTDNTNGKNNTNSNNATPSQTPTTSNWTLDNGWQIPVSVPEKASQDDWYDMGWETFIALNWQAKDADWSSTSNGGEPDKTANIKNAKIPYRAVWQTYIAPEQVFLAKGADPGSWDNPNNKLSTKADSNGNTLPILGGFSKGTASKGEKGGEFNEASSQPLIAQDSNFVSYEMRMNQSEFTYLTHYKYYDAVNQKSATKDNGTIESFPKTGTDESYLKLPDYAQQGALEIKASWRIITNTQFAKRYFTMNAFRTLPDGTVDGPHLFGLVGFHILRLTPNSGTTWYWATFEQVDNVQIDESPVPTGLTPSFNPGTSAPYPTYTKGYDGTPPQPVASGSPLPSDSPVNVSFIENAIQSGAIASNTKYHAMLPDTVWQYYQMIGVLNPAASDSTYTVPPFSNPTNGDQMVNTTMETYSQGTASKPKSCFSCHAFAAPLGAAADSKGLPAQAGNQIFTFLLDDAQSSK